MIALLRTLAIAAVEYGVAETLLRGQGAQRRLGRVVSGLVLLLMAAVAACVTLVFLLASLFFNLADQHQFVMPALITGLVGAVIAVALISEGWRKLRQ